MRAHVTIDWKDVPLYFEIFFPTSDGKVSNIDFAPTGITIFINAYRKSDETPVNIDMIPILQMRFMHKSFTCEFKHDPSLSLQEGTRNGQPIRKEVIAADIRTLDRLFQHHHRHWMWDVTTGRVRKLIVSHIGTERYPRAQFFLGPDEQNTIPSEFVYVTQKSSVLPSGLPLYSNEIATPQPGIDRYVRRVELRDYFIENPYVFLWDALWELPGRRLRAEPASWSSF
jgi:hypothetical protein